MHCCTVFFWGKASGVFKLQHVIICPYTELEQVTHVQRSSVFYDFTDIYGGWGCFGRQPTWD